jgi:hypothetical protein
MHGPANWLVGTAVVSTLLALPSASGAKSGCPTRDVRTMLADAGQGMNGRVIALRLDSGQTVRRRQFSQPGTQMIIEDFTYSAAGKFRATIRAEGGFGPGCGTARRRTSIAEKTIVIR